MRHVLRVFDDFLPNLMDIRREVIAAGFTTETHKDGLEYKGIGKREYPEIYAAMSEALGYGIVPSLSCFRINYAGEDPHSWVHSDECCAKYAAVMYMNLPEQCVGGTAFWKHIPTGLDYMPTVEERVASGVDPVEFGEAINRDTHDKSKWEPVSMAGMKFNRMIMYPTNMFHSRMPFDAFGDCPENGRIVFVSFFDVIPLDQVEAHNAKVEEAKVNG